MADASRWKRIRRRRLESYSKTWLGFIAIAVVAVLITALLFVKLLGIGYTHYTAEFLQAASLRPGNPITVAGIPVGTVTSTKLAGDHVEAGLRVRNNVVLGKNTKASIKITTILGSRYLDLRPDGDGTVPNRTIDLAHTEVPYDLQAALGDATTTFEQVDFDDVAQSLTILSNQLDGLPAVVPQAMENIQALSSIIATRRDQLGTLLKSTATVTNTLRRQQAGIGNLINQGQQLMGEFVVRRATFHAMMAAVTHLVGTLSKIVVHDRSSLDGLLANLEDLTKLLAQHDDLFRNLLQVAPVTIRGLTNATGSGNAVEFNIPAGAVIDSWMCAISGRAKQFNMIQYFKDCK
ncbi:MCE family protein [Mycobacterium sp.]|uniref:MCE family protein n=1 Tax=Mycobacterium sp. TaxID=1785 RepID=UPI003BAB1E00